MKLLTLLAAFLLVGGVFCGGTETPEQPTTEQPGFKAEDFPAEAFAELTEAEMGKLIKALPAVSEVLDAAGYDPEEPEEGDLAGGLMTAIEGVGKVAGVEAALKKAGMNWPEFRVATYKVMVAMVAFGVDMAMAMAEELGGDSPEVKEGMKELEAAKAFTSKVPQANKDMVFAHMDELEALELFGE